MFLNFQIRPGIYSNGSKDLWIPISIPMKRNIIVS